MAFVKIMPYKNGFSIIELMIALVIGVIIVGISLPVYFSYTNAAKISTSYPMIQAAEKKIATFYTQNNTFNQADNDALNINNDAQNTNVIIKFYISDGIITVEYISALSTDDTDTHPTLIFSPNYQNQAIIWSCAASSGISCPEGYASSASAQQELQMRTLANNIVDQYSFTQLDTYWSSNWAGGNYWVYTSTVSQDVNNRTWSWMYMNKNNGNTYVIQNQMINGSWTGWQYPWTYLGAFDASYTNDPNKLFG
ncbi:pilin [Cysteiniphilum halobium]|uniref:pilin n=1 Tax=Cysteiniphilum halobium TaxID=2219059 RepID=UPI003F8736AC